MQSSCNFCTIPSYMLDIANYCIPGFFSVLGCLSASFCGAGMGIAVGWEHLVLNVFFDEAQRLSRSCVVHIDRCSKYIGYQDSINFVVGFACGTCILNSALVHIFANSLRRQPYGPCRLLRNPICDSSITVSNLLFCAASSSNCSMLTQGE